jgi:AsmA family protein
MATSTPDTARRRPRHHWLLAALALVILALALCEAIGWPFLRGPIERALTKGLARQVEIGGDFRLHLLGSVRIRGERLVIRAPAEGPLLRDAAGRPRDFLDAGGVALALPYSSVLALARGRHDRPLLVSSLDVASIDVGLLRTADGAANWHFGEHERKDKAPPQLPQFDRLVVQNGKLHFEDAMTRVLLDVAVKTDEGRRAPNAAAPASAPRLEATASGRYRNSPVEARLESSGLLPLVAPQREAKPVPMTLKLKVGATELDLDGKVGDVLKLASLDGRFHLVAPSLAAVGDSLGITLPTTAPFQMDGRIAKADALWSANIASLVLGSSRLRGDFRYDTAPAKPKLTGQLGGARLALPDLAPAFGAPADKSQRAAARQTRERVLPQRAFDIPSLAAMEADVTLKLDSFFLGTPQLESLAPLDGRLQLHDSRLSVEDLLARSAGGEVRGGFALDARDVKQPRWDADLRWSGIQLERFVKPRDTLRKDADAKAKQKAGGAPGYVSGALSGRAQLAGSGRSIAALLASLDGTTQMWVKDGQISHLLIELSGIDLAESLGLVVRGDAPLPLRCAVTRLVIKDGTLTPEVGVIDTADTTLVVSGKVSLADEQLALLITARPRDMTPVALRGPLHIDGSFAQPQVHLDKQAIGLRVAAAAALAAVAAPLASLLAFVDLGDEDKAVCSEAAARMQGKAPRAAARAASQVDARRGTQADAKRATPAEPKRAAEPQTHRTQP